MFVELNKGNTAIVRLRAPYLFRDGVQGVDETVHTLADPRAISYAAAVFCMNNQVSPRMIEIAVTWPERPAPVERESASLVCMVRLGAKVRHNTAVGRV
jgi:hypothetical protein